MTYTFSFHFLGTYGRFFLNGLLMTLELSVFAVLLGTLFGTLMGLLRVSTNKLIKFLSGCYVEFVRGTPLLVQLYLFRYGLIILFPALSKISVFVPCVIALAFNSTAYVSEIMRAGINAVDVGQTEAGRSLGLTRGQTMRRIILPQAYRNILPRLATSSSPSLRKVPSARSSACST